LPVLSEFNQFDKYNPELLACLEKVEKRCEESPDDLNRKNFERMLEDSFAIAKTTKEFKVFYCQNFYKGKPDFNYNRKCDDQILEQELSKFKECSEMISSSHLEFDTVNSLCDQQVSIELEKNILQIK